jgi:hypothetical protein
MGERAAGEIISVTSFSGLAKKSRELNEEEKQLETEHGPVSTETICFGP